ncbi:hypothetical protein ACPF8X_31490, partial [Streptomyces sp. G35A]
MRDHPDRHPMAGHPERARPATARIRWPAGPVPGPARDGNTGHRDPAPATDACDPTPPGDGPATTTDPPRPAGPAHTGVDVLLRLRPLLAAAGL